MDFFQIIFLAFAAVGVVGGILFLRSSGKRLGDSRRFFRVLSLWCFLIALLAVLAIFSVIPGDYLPGSVLLATGFLLLVAGISCIHGYSREFPNVVSGKCLRITVIDSQPTPKFTFVLHGKRHHMLTDDGDLAEEIHRGDVRDIYASDGENPHIRLSTKGSRGIGIFFLVFGIILTSLGLLFILW